MAYAEEIDGSVLATLCEEPGPWLLEELEQEHGEGVKTIDAVNRLIARSLVLRIGDGFVMASAAGRYANEVNEERP